MNGSVSVESPRVAGTGRRPPHTSELRFEMSSAHPGTQHYRECVDIVKRKYLDRYRAAVHPQPDIFATLLDDTPNSPTFGCAMATAGLTTASGRWLLSESYLDDPVEQVCAKLVSVETRRSRIAELGPVVSCYPGCGAFLMRNLPRYAVESGYEFLLSTMTEQLHQVAKDAGWECKILANARYADLVDATGWGTYYETRPRTVLFHCGQSRLSRYSGSPDSLE